MISFQGQYSMLLTVPGRPPLCLKCQNVGHIMRDCPTNNKKDVTKTYASVTRTNEVDVEVTESENKAEKDKEEDELEVSEVTDEEEEEDESEEAEFTDSSSTITSPSAEKEKDTTMNVDSRIAVKRMNRSPGTSTAAKKKQTVPADKKVARDLDKEFIKHKKKDKKQDKGQVTLCDK